MSDKVGSNNKVIGLVSGNGVGKTTLSECLLFNSKATERLGKVEEKNTVSDFSLMEEVKGFSINSSIMHYKWKDFNINLIDSPGYSDFAGQSQSTLRVSDSVILVVDGKSGVQAPTEIILEMLAKNPKPMFVVLNKMDLENIDFFKTVDEIKSTQGLNLVPITIPVGSGENFSQVVDILQNKAYQYKDGTPAGTVTDIDAGMKDNIDTYHNALVESIVETNDELLDKYLEGEKIDDSILSNVFKNAVVSGEVVPVFTMSAAKNFGTDLLMDYINSLLPSSLDIPPVKAKILGKEEDETGIEPSSDGTPLAYVFKTMADPYIGKLSIFRIFSGTFKAGESYRVSSEEKPFKFANLFRLQGKKQIEISEATCGDIVAVSKLMKISNDDTISSIDKPLIMDKVEYLQPTLPRAIISKNKGDEEKIGIGLSKLIEEDQTLRQELNIEVHQSIIWGMGDLHLNITRDKLKEKYDVEVDMIKPDVAYKETIKKEAKTEYKYKKQSGGRGQYGHVFIELKPRKRGEGFEFTDSIIGGSIPKG